MQSVLDYFATTQTFCGRSLQSCSTERGSLIPFFVLAMEAREGPNTSRQSRESHGETRSTLLSQKVWRAWRSPNDFEGKVPVRSCRECHRKTEGHQILEVDRFVSPVRHGRERVCHRSTSKFLGLLHWPTFLLNVEFLHEIGVGCSLLQLDLFRYWKETTAEFCFFAESGFFPGFSRDGGVQKLPARLNPS